MPPGMSGRCDACDERTLPQADLLTKARAAALGTAIGTNKDAGYR